ncbi:MAG: 6-carboxytetrahydropterin synthase [Vulcanisaeta sp.]
MDATCLSMRFSFSSAHRVRFSGTYGSVHGHNYDVTIRICVKGKRDLVLDIDKVRQEVQPIIASFEGKYLKSTREDALGIGPSEYVEVPCIPEGVTGECVAWYLLDHVRKLLSDMGIKDLVEVQVVVCDSPLNCFEARSS